jgi:hypothetical protein
MDITLDAELRAAMDPVASQRGISAEDLALEALKREFLPKPQFEPRDDWERLLLTAASDCGVSLSNEALSSEGLYE